MAALEWVVVALDEVEDVDADFVDVGDGDSDRISSDDGEEDEVKRIEADSKGGQRQSGKDAMGDRRGFFLEEHEGEDIREDDENRT